MELSKCVQFENAINGVPLLLLLPRCCGCSLQWILPFFLSSVVSWFVRATRKRAMVSSATTGSHPPRYLVHPSRRESPDPNTTSTYARTYKAWDRCERASLASISNGPPHNDLGWNLLSTHTNEIRSRVAPIQGPTREERSWSLCFWNGNPTTVLSRH